MNLVGTMELMDPETERLIASLPLSEQALARSFLMLDPQRQRLHTFREQQEMNAKIDEVLRDLRELRKPATKKVLGVVVAIGGTLMAILYPDQIPRP